MAMKECPPLKILNLPTNRCVNINGIIGKKIRNQNYNIAIVNEHNSCYIDSLLVALFHFKSRVIYNAFFANKLVPRYASKIQKELHKIYRHINKNEAIETNNCSCIRKYLEKYYNELVKDNSGGQIFFNNSDNWITKQIDVFELLTFLDKIFDFKSNVKVKEGTNKYNKNMIVEVSSHYLIGTKALNISSVIPMRQDKYELDARNYYKNSKGKLVKYYEKIYEIYKTNGILIIELYRNTGTEKLNTSIIYPDTIKVREDKKELKLRSIILHKGSTIHSGHYTTIIRRSGKSYEYDDLSSNTNKLKEISDEYERKMRKNAVALIYSR